MRFSAYEAFICPSLLSVERCIFAPPRLESKRPPSSSIPLLLRLPSRLPARAARAIAQRPPSLARPALYVCFALIWTRPHRPKPIVLALFSAALAESRLPRSLVRFVVPRRPPRRPWPRWSSRTPFWRPRRPPSTRAMSCARSRPISSSKRPIRCVHRGPSSVAGVPARPDAGGGGPILLPRRGPKRRRDPSAVRSAIAVCRRRGHRQAQGPARRRR